MSYMILPSSSCPLIEPPPQEDSKARDAKKNMAPIDFINTLILASVKVKKLVELLFSYKFIFSIFSLNRSLV